MITYKKNALKTKVIYGDNYDRTNRTEMMARRVAEFINEGKFKRIADIQYVGETHSMIAIIIYEKEKAG